MVGDVIYGLIGARWKQCSRLGGGDQEREKCDDGDCENVCFLLILALKGGGGK